MKKKILLWSTFLVISVFTLPTFAYLISNKPHVISIPLTHSSHTPLLSANTTGDEKNDSAIQVAFMDIQLTPNEKRAFLNFHSNPMPHLKNFNEGLPTQASISMNGVPVLNQGIHGSCTTFANTAAIDALLGKGDYISQLCHLNLGRYLNDRGYFDGGWEGSFSQFVLDQILRFGFINMTNQKVHACGGISDYPVNNLIEIGTSMSLDEFKSLSENVNSETHTFKWQPLLTVVERTDENPLHPYNADNLLMQVKQIIAKGQSRKIRSLITFGVYLPNLHCGSPAGSCATHHAPFDTWAIVPSPINDEWIGGHEMIITGYDDNATAQDTQGNTHTGLLTLRNSWSNRAGDNGDYYMTYDYFKRYVVEAQKLMLVKE